MEVNEKAKRAYVCKVIYIYVWHLKQGRFFMYRSRILCTLHIAVDFYMVRYKGMFYFDAGKSISRAIARGGPGDPDGLTEGRTVSGQKARRNDRRTERHIVRQSGRPASSLQQIFICFNSYSRKNDYGISVYWCSHFQDDLIWLSLPYWKQYLYRILFTYTIH